MGVPHFSRLLREVRRLLPPDRGNSSNLTDKTPRLKTETWATLATHKSARLKTKDVGHPSYTESPRLAKCARHGPPLHSMLVVSQPSTTKRYFGAGHLHFITSSCYHRYRVVG